MQKPLTEQDFHSLASKRNFVWIGAIVVGSHVKTLWRCPVGHEWSATRANVYSGRGCPVCDKISITKPASYYHELATSRGFKWIGANVVNMNALTEWQCSLMHTWKSACADIRRGNGCPHCAGLSPKTAGDYAKTARQRGFIWLGPLPDRTHELTRWQCSEGHTWAQSYANIKHNQSNCPECSREMMAEKRRLKPAAYHELANRRGFHWIGPKVPNSNTKTFWECPEQHQWDSTYSNIHSGNNCPHCLDMVNGALVSSPQRAIHALVGGTLNYPVKRYRIDIALADSTPNIAIEYDCSYWHTESHDAKRDAYLFSQGWHILRIKSGRLLPTNEQIDNAIGMLKGGLKYTEIVLADWSA